MKPEPRKATLRCAVYTRVSTEHSLDQEFNSLDNQRKSSPLIARVESSSGSDMKRENDHKDCFKHFAAGQNGKSRRHVFRSADPLLWPRRTFQ
jgi:hypothetical protein